MMLWLKHTVLSIHLSYCHQVKEGNVLFNNTLNTFYFWLYGVSGSLGSIDLRSNAHLAGGLPLSVG